MAKGKHGGESVRSRLLHAAAQLFLEKGYAQATIREIAAAAEVNRGSLGFAFPNKESILCELVSAVLDAQMSAVRTLLDGKTEDRLLIYATERTLQLYMAESSEHMREMYTVTYSLPNSAQIVYRKITERHVEIFREHLPALAAKDFYEREIAAAGIMRNFITVPCDIYFTMERKVRVFLETTLLIYGIPRERISKIIGFVSQFDFKTVATEVLSHMLTYLEERT